MKYEEISEWNREAVDQALRDDDADALLRAVIEVSMYNADWLNAQSLCVRLWSHAHYIVPSNAVLGFGHVARVRGKLNREVVQSIVKAALRDEDDYIQDQAYATVSNTAFFSVDVCQGDRSLKC